MSSCDHMLLIKQNELFSQITDEEYEQLQLLHRFKETSKNQYIYFEAHLHNCLYFLKEGNVKIGYYDKDGNEVIKEILGKGDIFGQLTLLPNNMEGEFAQAYKSDVSLCMFRIEEFEKLLVAKPELSIRFTRQIGEKIARLENRMVNLLQKDVRHRLLYFFYSLVKQHPELVQNNAFTTVNVLTHDDLSKLIASSRQTVTTMLTQLQKEGLVDFSRQYIKVPDVKELQKLVSVG
jgi:CRP/FNR family transcriptional regulator, cyclic AMP receptor protein